VDLEDADYELLKSAFLSFPFRLAHRDLVEIGKAFD